MLKVRDLMTSDVVSINSEDTAASAADLMSALGISALPVRGPAGQFVGVLSQSDLINPRLAGTLRHPTVEDIMTADVLAVQADDPALTAVVAMASHDIHRIFVLDAKHRLVGVVTSLDIVKALARGRLFDLDAPGEVLPGLDRSVA
jgi:CBS-domain-containing membrane protein